jgi:hypothetical protein
MLQAELTHLRQRLIAETESYLSSEIRHSTEHVLLPLRRPPHTSAYVANSWPRDGRVLLSVPTQPSC